MTLRICSSGLARRSLVTLMLAALCGIVQLRTDVHAQTLTVTGQSTCATCEIVITARNAYGLRSDSIGLVGPLYAATWGGEVYIVSDFLPTAGVLVYGADGSLSRTLGRSGRGPGEFQKAVRIAVARDEMFVQDRSGILQVFAPDGSFLRILRGIPPSLTNIAIAGDSTLVVIASNSRPPGGADRPVHMYHTKAGKLIGSAGPKRDLRPGQKPSVTHVAAGSDGSVWAIQPPGEITRWSTDGTLLTKLRWSPTWLAHVDRSFSGITPDEQSLFGRDVWQDPETGLLWVLTEFADPRVEEPFPELAPGAPMPDDYFSPARLNRIITTIVSVVDPVRGAVLAHVRIPGAADQFADDGRLVLLQEDEDGHQWVELIQMELVRR